MKFDAILVGIYSGILIAAMHLFWIVLVALGLAQGLTDWIYGIHFLNNPFVVGFYDPMTAMTLLAVTFGVGFVGGWASTVVWNKMQRRK